MSVTVRLCVFGRERGRDGGLVHELKARPGGEAQKVGRELLLLILVAGARLGVEVPLIEAPSPFEVGRPEGCMFNRCHREKVVRLDTCT